MRGPESRARLEALASTGFIQEDSLVSDSANGPWQPYRALIPAPAPSEPDTPPDKPDLPQCSRCGAGYRPNDLLAFKDLLLCASCKRDYFQHIAQGTLQARLWPPHAFTRRALAKAVDMLLITLFCAGMQSTLRLFEPSRLTNWPELVSGGVTLVLFLVVSTLAMARLGGTPGKLIFHLRVTDGNGEAVGHFQSFARAVAELLSLASGGLGYMLTGNEGERRPLHDMIARTHIEYLEGPWPWQR